MEETLPEEFFDEKKYKTMTQSLIPVIEAARNRFRWNTNNHDFPKGLTAEDLIQDAVMKILTGEKPWDRKVWPDIGKFIFFTIIRDRITTLWRLGDNRLNNPGVLNTYTNDGVFIEPIQVIPQKDNSEKDEESKKIIEKIEKLLEGDDEKSVTNFCVFQEMKKGFRKDEDIEISKALTIPIKEVRNAKKRIKRIILKGVPEVKIYAKPSG